MLSDLIDAPILASLPWPNEVYRTTFEGWAKGALQTCLAVGNIIQRHAPAGGIPKESQQAYYFTCSNLAALCSLLAAMCGDVRTCKHFADAAHQMRDMLEALHETEFQDPTVH